MKGINLLEKAATGWFSGCNSSKSQYLLRDDQYRWGVNVVNRGGIVQTRPGYRVRLTVPEGNFQGARIFKANKPETDNNGKTFMVFAVDGKIYAVPFNSDGSIDQPVSFTPFKLSGIQFDPLAKRIYWETSEKTSQITEAGTLVVVPSHSVLMMQDGGLTNAAYYDGDLSAHLDETRGQTPRGSWMKSSGNRLWIARGSSVVYCDLLDPLSATQRAEGQTRGDFKFSGEVTGLANSVAENRQSNLLVFTARNTSALLSSILDEELWSETTNFQTLVYPYTGCIAGDSIVDHSGLLWWYTADGLVYADVATTSFLTSQIRIRDVEMAYSKRNFAPDISGICGVSNSGYLLMSVPSGDTFNAHTMVIDTSVSDELGSQLPPAWQGVWTGIRPISWTSEDINGQRRVFAASVDYSPLGGSFNHIWEAFQSNRADSYDILNADQVIEEVSNPIYCEFESKQLGDGMDLKRFMHAEVHAAEIGGDVRLRVSYAGTKGSYHTILDKKISANVEPPIGNDVAQQLYQDMDERWRVQSRQIYSSSVVAALDGCPSIEGFTTDDIDMAFSLRFQWCGRLGIERFRIFMQPYSEPSQGKCEENENDVVNVVSEDGFSYQIKNEENGG